VKPYKFALVAVFTEQPLAGNQLAVFPNAQGLTDDQMQAIAREFNYSLQSRNARIRFRRPRPGVFPGHRNLRVAEGTLFL